MSEENEKQKVIEEICQKIIAMGAAQHLSEEDKLSFARKALEIIHGSSEENASK